MELFVIYIDESQGKKAVSDLFIIHNLCKYSISMLKTWGLPCLALHINEIFKLFKLNIFKRIICKKKIMQCQYVVASDIIQTTLWNFKGTQSVCSWHFCLVF